MYYDVSWHRCFGAHVLEDKLNEKYISVWEKATTYQMYHGLGLILIGIISGTTSMNVNWAGWLMFWVSSLVVRFIF